MLPAEIIEHYDRRSVLLCYPEGDTDDEISDVVASWHRFLLVIDHEWSLGSPELIDQVEDDDRTVGVAIQLLPPLDRSGAAIPRALDSLMLEVLVDAAKEVTRDSGLELAFELDGMVVGWVAAGETDTQLSDGLLWPWRERVIAPS